MAEAKAYKMIPYCTKDTITYETDELVRCKDCKHGEKCNSVYLCGKSRGFGIAHDPSWFCADGERRTDDA